MTENSNNTRTKFGSVEVSSVKPPAAVVKRNVDWGQSALLRAAKGLSKPGVKLSLGKGTPRYSVDEADPDIFVRVLNGKKARGRFVDGAFQRVK